MPPLKRRLIEALVGRHGAEEKRNQTILAAKEKNPLRWRTGKVRIYDALPGLNVMPSSFEGCLMQTSQKSGINYLDIFD